MKRIWIYQICQRHWQNCLGHSIVFDWSLKASNAPIGVASFNINQYLPTEEEINKYLK